MSHLNLYSSAYNVFSALAPGSLSFSLIPSGSLPCHNITKFCKIVASIEELLSDNGVRYVSSLGKPLILLESLILGYFCNSGCLSISLVLILLSGSTVKIFSNQILSFTRNFIIRRHFELTFLNFK